MANEIKFQFAGDSASLERAMDRAGAGAKDMADDFTSAGKEAGRFSGSVTSLNDRIDSSESKFMGAADLADGLASAFGINVGPTIEYARAFGDMAGGFTGLVAPAMENLSGKLGKLSFVTKIQTAAQAALNMVMRANPIMLAVTAVAALVAIVDGAMSGVRKAIGWTTDTVQDFGRAIGDVASDAAHTLGRIADIITTPYQLAFRAIASLWNNTVGRLSFSIPGWVPGIGGAGFDVPDIPMLASGGIARAGRPHIVGERGPELFIPGQTGTVVPNSAMGAQTITVVFAGGMDAFTEALRKTVKVLGGGNVQKAFGS